MKTDVPASRGMQGDNAWYSRSLASVAETLDVDPAHGLTAAAAADRRRGQRPQRLARGETRAGLAAFLDEYRSYMKIILIAAALVSLFVQEWGTAVLLMLLTVLNAVIGLRPKVGDRRRSYGGERGRNDDGEAQGPREGRDIAGA